MDRTSKGKLAILRAQWRLAAVTAVAVALLVPVAIAWACNPQASVRVDKPTYLPGETMQVSGAYFKGDRTLTVSVEPGGPSITVNTTSNGFFATQMPAPSAAGSYTLSVIGYEADGSVTTGLPARASFQVSQPSPATQPGTTAPSQQGSPGTSPGSSQPGAGRFTEPGVPKAGRIAPRSPSKARAQGGRPGADRRAAVNNGAGLIESSSGGVFAGSVARADRVAAVASPAKRAAPRKARSGGTEGATPSERSALSDVWSGLSSANAPTLLPSASDGAPSGGGTGPGLALGLGLMGFALLALAGGLAAARSRRRASGR